MKKLMFIPLIALLSGCTTLADARLAKGTGLKNTYAGSYEKVWEAAVCSLNGRGLSIADENKKEGYILAQKGLSALSYGENVAVFIRQKSSTETEVEAVSKKVMATTIFATDWSKDILDGINGCLK